jgi:putative FmdB family regulatory protein
MPTYQYACPQCKTNFEYKQGFNDDSPVACPKCKVEARRLFLPVPIIFKGSGFYVTDNKKPSGDQSVAKIPDTPKDLSVSKDSEAKPPATV